MTTLFKKLSISVFLVLSLICLVDHVDGMEAELPDFFADMHAQFRIPNGRHHGFSLNGSKYNTNRSGQFISVYSDDLKLLLNLNSNVCCGRANLAGYEALEPVFSDAPCGSVDFFVDPKTPQEDSISWSAPINLSAKKDLSQKIHLIIQLLRDAHTVIDAAELTSQFIIQIGTKTGIQNKKTPLLTAFASDSLMVLLEGKKNIIWRKHTTGSTWHQEFVQETEEGFTLEFAVATKIRFNRRGEGLLFSRPLYHCRFSSDEIHWTVSEKETPDQQEVYTRRITSLNNLAILMRAVKAE